MKRHCFLAALFVFSIAHSEERLAIPDNASQQAAEAKLKAQYKSEYARRVLAEQRDFAILLFDASEEEKDVAMRYVQLRDAREIATRAIGIDLALDVSERMSEIFATDALADKSALLPRFLPHATVRVVANRLSDISVGEYLEYRDARRMDLAAKALDVASAAARGSVDPQRSNRIEKYLKELLELEKENARGKGLEQALKKAPDDPGANLAYGKFRALFFGDWKGAAPYLLKGNDPWWKQIGQDESENPKDVKGQVDLGDRFWNFAELIHNLDAAAKRNFHTRAAYWFALAVNQLEGERRANLEEALAPKISVAISDEHNEDRRLKRPRNVSPEKFRTTVTSIKAALAWLAKAQEPDGHWDAKKFGAWEKTDTAVTALALLAFLRLGNSELDGQYMVQVKRAIGWLRSKQSQDGLIWDTTDAGGHRGCGYPHAIALLAMAEASSRNLPSTRAATQLAVDYATNVHQSGFGNDMGAWRYKPKDGPDLDVSGWFILALTNAKKAGLKVPQASFNGAELFLNSVEHVKAPGAPSEFWYTVKDEHAATFHRLTALGLLCRQLTGTPPEKLQISVDNFMKKGGLPTWGANGKDVDLYYWFFGTQCTFNQGGLSWQRWNEALLQVLLPSQIKQGADAGSWDPIGCYNAEWGRVGQTALSALCLETYCYGNARWLK